MRAPRVLAAVAALALLAACGPSVDREGPARVAEQTDDLARTVMTAAAVALRLDPSEVNGLADARRCEDHATVRHQVDDSYEVLVTDPELAARAVVGSLGLDDVEATAETTPDGARVTGSDGDQVFAVTIGREEQDVTVRSRCLDVGRVQAVEISFDSRYRVRIDER